MELVDLQPKKVTFVLHFGDDCIFLSFRPYSIADDMHAVEVCKTKGGIQKVFDDFDFPTIALIGWYQLTKESQKLVIDSVDGSYFDPETGEDINANLSPINKFRTLFTGIQTQLSLLTNLIKSKGLNIPDLNDPETLKKWNDQLNKVKP